MIARLIITVASVYLLIAPAMAEDAPNNLPPRISGIVEALDDQTLRLKSISGEDVALTLPPDIKVIRSKPASLADVKSGEFIGCTAVEGPDGKLHAEEIHIIPEAMRGLGEGHYPWG